MNRSHDFEVGDFCQVLGLVSGLWRDGIVQHVGLISGTTTVGYRITLCKDGKEFNNVTAKSENVRRRPYNPYVEISTWADGIWIPRESEQGQQLIREYFSDSRRDIMGYVKRNHNPNNNNDNT